MSNIFYPYEYLGMWLSAHLSWLL